MTYGSRYTPYNSHAGFASFAGIVLVIAAFFAWLGFDYSLAHEHNSVQVLKIISLDDQATQQRHQYLVFTDKGVFKDTDNIWLGKWNSSNLYNELLQHPHGTFRCNVHGERQQITSNYPDLISCTLVSATTTAALTSYMTHHYVVAYGTNNGSGYRNGRVRPAAGAIEQGAIEWGSATWKSWGSTGVTSRVSIWECSASCTPKAAGRITFYNRKMHNGQGFYSEMRVYKTRAGTTYWFAYGGSGPDHWYQRSCSVHQQSCTG